MNLSNLLIVSLLFAFVGRSFNHLITIEKELLHLSITHNSGNLHFRLKEGVQKDEKLAGIIGRNIQNSSNYQPCRDVPNCIEFENGILRLHVLNDIDDGFTIYWTTQNVSKQLEDCFELSNFNWYGGPERKMQVWPIEKQTLIDFANVPKENQWGAIVEPYWLNSAGAYIFVNDKVPLFISQNGLSTRNKVCFSAKIRKPYPSRHRVVLHYTVVAKSDARKAHLHAVKHFLGKPSGHPNYKILERPIWSTWARYKRNINDSALLNFANEIVDNGYSDGQFEIDDHWEECYGALTFNTSRFGDINKTITKIKELNFRVSLWIHPFVNTDCSKYSEIGRRYGYFVKNTKGSDLTRWWNSRRNQAHHLDFTKAEVRSWFTERLRNLQNKHGIDSFKFDAGETSWPPQISVLNGDTEARPNVLTVEYVRTCAAFGDLIEIRTGWRTQYLPVLVRMIDKDSRWGLYNGLSTLITTLLQMNMNGYTLVLPDMIGGNGYNRRPSAELFVRWLQANTFMPSTQFSYVPWDFDNENLPFNVREISKRFVHLHRKITPYIVKTMKNSIEKGYLVNPPIWWVDPLDQSALKEDTEFLLGEDILAAPVIKRRAVGRRVYLPQGRWVDGNNGRVYEGPFLIDNYSAPIEVLPYFVRDGSEALQILKDPRRF